MKILINGFCGNMGQTIYNLAQNMQDITVSEGVDKQGIIMSFPNTEVKLYSDINDSCDCDVVVDFSHASALKGILDFCKKNKKPVVLATTGYNEEDAALIKKAAKEIPVFQSSNMSEGVFAMLTLIKKAMPILDGWDIEIVEKHHNHKKDTPSGTSLMMTKEVLAHRKDSNLMIGRGQESGVREKADVCVHSVRGGGVPGEHEIIFFAENETLSIKHEAYSRKIFAKGALSAAKFIADKTPGYYTMADIFA